jgi:hypothetical protein
MTEDNRTLPELYGIAYGGVQGKFVLIWNNGDGDDDVDQVPHTHWYSSKYAIPGAYRVRATYRGETREIVVQPCQNWQGDTRYYIDFEEPEPEPVADSCISVNSNVEGVSVLIEVDNA